MILSEVYVLEKYSRIFHACTSLKSGLQASKFMINFFHACYRL